MLNLTSVQDLAAKIEMDQVIRNLDIRRFRANMIGKFYTLPPLFLSS